MRQVDEWGEPAWRWVGVRVERHAGLVLLLCGLAPGLLLLAHDSVLARGRSGNPSGTPQRAVQLPASRDPASGRSAEPADGPLILLERMVWHNPHEGPSGFPPYSTQMPELKCGGVSTKLPDFGIPTTVVARKWLGDPPEGKLSWLDHALNCTPEELRHLDLGSQKHRNEVKHPRDPDNPECPVPPDPASHALYGYVLAKMGDWLGAEHFWRRACEMSEANREQPRHEQRQGPNHSSLTRALYLPLYVAYCHLGDARKARNRLWWALREYEHPGRLWTSDDCASRGYAVPQGGGIPGVSLEVLARAFDMTRFVEDDLWADRIAVPIHRGAELDASGLIGKAREIVGSTSGHSQGDGDGPDRGDCLRRLRYAFAQAGNRDWQRQLGAAVPEAKEPSLEAIWRSAPTCLDVWGDGRQPTFPTRETQTKARCRFDTRLLSITADRRAMPDGHGGYAYFLVITIREKIRVDGSSSSFHGIAVGWRASLLPGREDSLQGMGNKSVFGHGSIPVTTTLPQESPPLLAGVSQEGPRQVRAVSAFHDDYCDLCSAHGKEECRPEDFLCSEDNSGGTVNASVLKFYPAPRSEARGQNAAIEYEAEHRAEVPIGDLEKGTSVRIELTSVPALPPELVVTLRRPQGYRFIEARGATTTRTGVPLAMGMARRPVGTRASWELVPARSLLVGSALATWLGFFVLCAALVTLWAPLGTVGPAVRISLSVLLATLPAVWAGGVFVWKVSALEELAARQGNNEFAVVGILVVPLLLAVGVQRWKGALSPLTTSADIDGRGGRAVRGLLLAVDVFVISMVGALLCPGIGLDWDALPYILGLVAVVYALHITVSAYCGALCGPTVWSSVILAAAACFFWIVAAQQGKPFLWSLPLPFGSSPLRGVLWMWVGLWCIVWGASRGSWLGRQLSLDTHDWMQGECRRLHRRQRVGTSERLQLGIKVCEIVFLALSVLLAAVALYRR